MKTLAALLKSASKEIVRPDQSEEQKRLLEKHIERIKLAMAKRKDNAHR